MGSVVNLFQKNIFGKEKSPKRFFQDTAMQNICAQGITTT